MSRDTKIILSIVLGCWFIGGFFYVLGTPDPAFGQDFKWHLQYTRSIVVNGHLPHPYEGNETYQPPLYYLICSALAPHSPRHVFYVRLFGLICGGGVLALIAWLLTMLRVKPLIQLAVLLFLATTPKFLFLFSIYNNDTFAAALCIALIVLSWRLLTRWDRRLAGVVAAVITAGLYTKYMMGYTLFIVDTLVLWLMWSRQIPKERGKTFLLLTVLTSLVFVPWMARTMRLTGKPVVASKFVEENQLPAQITIPKKPFWVAVTPPGLTPGEWHDPFVHLWEAANNKKSSYLAYLFASSVFGEFDFQQPFPVWSWIILWTHILVTFGALLSVRKGGPAQLAGATLLLASLIQASSLFYFPCAGLMDFRFISWTWAAWAVLYAWGAKKWIYRWRGGDLPLILVPLLVGTLFQTAFIVGLTVPQ